MMALHFFLGRGRVLLLVNLSIFHAIPLNSMGKIKECHVGIKGCQELASHGVAHPFLLKEGTTPGFDVPIRL